MKSKPYTFTPSQENLLRFSKLSARQKLEWLEEANQFVDRVVSRKKRREWERFRLYGKRGFSLAQKYQHEVEKITKQIVDKYKPQRVYLFGSVARKQYSRDSDLDFLIIKQDTPYYGADRIRELRKLIHKELPADFLIYQPGEFEERLKLGDPFLKAILKEGVLLYGK